MIANSIGQISHSANARSARVDFITATVLATSPQTRSTQFTAIETADLQLLFDLYDAHFFDGELSPLLREANLPPVAFRLSNRMTRAAGRTIQRRTRVHQGPRSEERVEYQIAISTLLLFEAFRNDPVPRSVEVAGVICHTRLEVLMRIIEHELPHLAEFLIRGTSNCAAAPFHELSLAIFGHTSSVHTLITPIESAARHHSIHLGYLVAFDHAGCRRKGMVNRITQRASVLVPDERGRLYADGGRYLLFLVPLDRLSRV